MEDKQSDVAIIRQFITAEKAMRTAVLKNPNRRYAGLAECERALATLERLSTQLSDAARHAGSAQPVGIEEHPATDRF